MYCYAAIALATLLGPGIRIDPVTCRDLADQYV